MKFSVKAISKRIEPEMKAVPISEILFYHNPVERKVILPLKWQYSAWDWQK